jgi:hypothetical protein
MGVQVTGIFPFIELIYFDVININFFGALKRIMSFSWQIQPT